MKIAVPMAGGGFCGHFGAARDFWIFDAVGGEPGEGARRPAPEHKPGALPSWLAQQGVDAVVVTAIGERALYMLADAGIETFLAEGETDPVLLVRVCLRGRLRRATGENSGCDGSHHDHSHDCASH